MPDMDGYEFLKRARGLRREGEGQIPAIAITAYARPETANARCSRDTRCIFPSPSRQGNWSPVWSVSCASRADLGRRETCRATRAAIARC